MYYAFNWKKRKMKNLKKTIVFVYIFFVLFISFLLGCAEAQEQGILAEDFKKRAVQYRQMGCEIQQKGDFDKALSFYQMAVGLDPYYTAAYNDIGITYETKGLIDLAEKNYLKAIDVDKQYLPAYTNLAYLYEKKADVLKAANYWIKRISLGDPDDPWTEKARENLRSLVPLSDKVKKIVVKFDKEYSPEVSKAKEYSDVKIDSIRSKKNFEIGKKLFEQGNYIAARQMFEFVMSLNPDNPVVMQYYEKAKAKEIEQAIGDHASLGIRFYKAGYTESAREEFGKILTIIPAQSDQR